MGTGNKSVTWPYAYKTIAMYESNPTYVLPYGVYDNHNNNVCTRSEIALQIYPPLYVYKTVGLYMHLNYTFNSGVPAGDQILQGIYVRDSPSSYVRAYASSVANYMPLGLHADANRNINISLDLSSLITGNINNVVFLAFNSSNAVGIRSAGGDTLNLWKLDLVYQTITVRDEK